MRRTLAGFILGVLLSAGVASATPSTSDVSHQHGWYRVWVVCPGMAEDAMGHLQLRVFDPPRAVYRCTRYGY